MTGANADQITVIGAGIVGLCSARYLQLKGMRVTLIDRLGAAEACSFGNAGVLSAWSVAPLSLPGVWKSVPGWLLHPDGPLTIRWRYLPQVAPWFWRFLRAAKPERVKQIAAAMHVLYQPTVELYQSLLRGSGFEHLIRESSYLHVYRSAAKLHLDGLAWRLRREYGAGIEVLRGGEIQEVEPELSRALEVGVRIYPQAHCIDPGGLGRALLQIIERDGGRLQIAEVKDIRPQPDGHTLLQTTGGEFRADKLVITAGAWSARLLRPLGIKLPLDTERGYHVTFADPGIRLNNPVLDTDYSFVATSMTPGLRCAGTEEFAGLDAPPHPTRAKRFLRLGKDLLPGLDTARPSEWMGHRPSFPDNLPVIGPLTGYRNIWLGFGHGHLGLTGAASTGRLIAQLANGETPNVDLGPYHHERFDKR